MRIGQRFANKVNPEAIPGWAAGIYDKAAYLAIDSFYGPLAKEIVAALPTGRLLDVGTGPGYLPLEIVKRAKNISVVGIDATARMIHIARLHAEAKGLGQRLDFRIGNAYSLAFRDNSFDMVISTGVLHAWKNPARALTECHRVLRPGGSAWILDPAKILDASSLPVWRRSLNRWDKFVYKIHCCRPLASRLQTLSFEEVKNLLAKTPFKDGYLERRDGIVIKLRK